MDEQHRTKIQKEFSSVKTHMVSWIKSLKMSKPNQTKILTRLEKINLFWLNDLQAKKLRRSPLESISWGIAYDPIYHSINIGLEVLKYNHNSNLFAVLAHEMGHAIDPCRWGAFVKGANPFKKVVSCLRSKKSVHAKKRNDALMAEMVINRKLRPTLSQSLQLHPTCNRLEYPPVGVQSDQIGESFADWFSAEVVGHSKKDIQHFRDDLCKNQKLNAGSSYPTDAHRLSRIYLTQPNIIKALNLKFKQTGKYCKF